MLAVLGTFVVLALSVQAEESFGFRPSRLGSREGETLVCKDNQRARVFPLSDSVRE